MNSGGYQNKAASAVFLFFLSTNIIFYIPSCFSTSSTKQADAHNAPWDVAVIGGGCAGLSAAFTASYMCYKTILFMGESPGGQLLGSNLVENIPGMVPRPGWEVVRFLQEQAEHAGTRVMYDAVMRIETELVRGKRHFVLTTGGGTRISATALILAMGGTPRTLRIADEEKYLNQAVFTCPRCDGLRAKGRDVVVVGGGDASIDTIMTLLGFGARKCTLLVRGAKMRATQALQERILRNPLVSIKFQSKICQFRGNGQKLEGLVLETAHGVEELATEYVFYAIGHEPNTSMSWVKEYVACDSRGYVIIDLQTQATSHPGIFAAGDIASPLFHQASYAMGCGQLAAKSAIDYVVSQQS